MYQDAISISDGGGKNQGLDRIWAKVEICLECLEFIHLELGL